MVWFSEWESFEAVPPYYPGQASVPTDYWQPGSGPVHASDYQWLVKQKTIGLSMVSKAENDRMYHQISMGNGQWMKNAWYLIMIARACSHAWRLLSV